MDENQKPVEVPTPTDAQVPGVESANPAQGGIVVSEHSVAPVVGRFHLPVRVFLSSGVMLAIVAGMLFSTHFMSDHTAKVVTVENTKQQPTSKDTVAKAQAQATSPPANMPPPTAAASNQTTAKVKTPPVTPAPTSTPWVNTKNCLPQNPSQYATYYIGMTNSQYLQTNGYGDTTKLYAALQFAGLIDTVNSKQYVVFAPDDWVFDNKLTAAQLAWMNQSPANMRAVLGWQIATSCITWAGVNPVENLATSTKVTVNTLNGPVTYTHGGPGTLGNAGIAIWDWFTSNGSVTFVTDFVDKSAIP